MKVNYGINRISQSGKRGIEHSGGSLEIEGRWDLDATHDEIKAAIREKHPRWNITGYALVEESK